VDIERVEAVAPKTAVFRQPRVELLERFRVERIHAPLRDVPRLYEAVLAKHAQMA
jgi:hypothetical protein